jgi:hypothetical protein
MCIAAIVGEVSTIALLMKQGKKRNPQAVALAGLKYAVLGSVRAALA